MELSNAVVVGVDGSASGFAAAEQAAQEAALHGVGLHIVSALTMPALPAAAGAKTYEVVVDATHAEAETYLAVAVSRARAVAPGVEVSSAVMPGVAFRVLVVMSREVVSPVGSGSA